MTIRATAWRFTVAFTAVMLALILAASSSWAGDGAGGDGAGPDDPGLLVTQDPIWVPVDPTNWVPPASTLVIRCKFGDRLQDTKGEPAEPAPPGGWETFFTSQGAGQGAVYDYLNSQLQATQFYNAHVTPWYQMKATEADFIAARNADLNGGRRSNVETCAAMADPDYHLPNYRRLVIVLNAPSTADNSRGGDLTGGYPFWLTFDGTTAAYGATVIGSNGFDMNGLLHEMLHAYPVAGGSMPHGRSAPAPGQASSADYRDPYDVMSAFNNYADGTGPWGPQAGNLGAAVRELAGFMPEHRRLDYVPDEKCVCYRNTTLTVRSLGVAGPGLQLVKIPVGDASGHYYTVEYRTRAGFDRALPGDGVLIHEVRPDNHAYLITRTADPGAEWNAHRGPGDRWDAPLFGGWNLSVTTDSITATEATISITVT